MQGKKPFQWDAETDVVICGFGGAGAAAAIEAHDRGLDVWILDRFEGGGATAISGGVVYLGGGTEIQQEAGVQDNAENMFQYLQHEVADAVSKDTLRAFCEQSVENYQWLKENGVPFQPTLCPDKTSYPSNKYYLYYSGNESFPPYNREATPAPRGHRAHGKGVSGAALFGPLRRAVARRGIQLYRQSRVISLVQDDQGNVMGVCYRQIAPGSTAAHVHMWANRMLIRLRYVSIYMGLTTKMLKALIERIESKYTREYTVRARKAVILATGGFFHNTDMVHQHAPAYRAGMPLGTIADDGSGIRMAEKAGASIGSMERISAWRFINPPQAFVKGILVDGRGQRLCNEMLYGDTLGARIMHNPDNKGKAWLVVDRAIWREAAGQLGPSRAMWFQALSGFVYLFLERRKAPTLARLARKINIKPDSLVRAVDGYNAQARKGTDPYGKPVDFLQPLETGPYYALNVSYDSRLVPCPSLSLGGLQADESSGQVLDTEGANISGLYAIGRTAVGIPSNGYVSGLSIADCIFSGRRAARHIADQT